MKNAFKVLCFTLAVIIVVTSAFLIYFKWDKSQFEYVDGTEKGTVMITGYKDESKDVTIPSKLRGKKVTQIDTSAFEESDITSIEIGDNVTYIGKSAFRGCKSLKTVKLGKSILNIDEGSFNDCTSLEEIKLPKSLEKLGGSVFAGCTSLKNVEISSNTSTLYFPIDESSAIICLFLFVSSTVSLSIIIIFSIPFLISVSVAYPPTPPRPTIATTLELILFIFSSPINFSSLLNIYITIKIITQNKKPIKVRDDKPTRLCRWVSHNKH